MNLSKLSTKEIAILLKFLRKKSQLDFNEIELRQQAMKELDRRKLENDSGTSISTHKRRA